MRPVDASTEYQKKHSTKFSKLPLVYQSFIKFNELTLDLKAFEQPVKT